jgi:hypothetical protein
VPADRIADVVSRGPGKNGRMLRWVRDFMRRHPDAEICVYDPKAPSGAVPPPGYEGFDEDAYERAFGGSAVLSGDEVATVRQALADALRHRTPPSDRHGAYLGIEQDERLSAEYAMVLARLGGAL